MNTGFIWGIRSRNGKESYNNLNTVNARRSRKTKGFTLVELIVVLVIIAILAAIAVPTMIGFIDRAREKKYQMNAQAALTATQTALNDIYSDAGNRYTPTKRAQTQTEAEVGVNEDDKDTEFTVWTEDILWDGKTVATAPNIGSYTIYKALYRTGERYYAYDGENWEYFDSRTKAEEFLAIPDSKSDNAIYVWPYKQDFAYIGGLDGDDPIIPGDDGDNIFKVVTLKVNPDPEIRPYAYFAQKGRAENSGKESIQIVFWKKNNTTSTPESYWTVAEDGTDLFKVDDYYTYYFKTIDSIKYRFTLTGWKLDTDPGTTFASIGLIEDYIFGRDDKNFTFVAQIDASLKGPLVARLSKSAFQNFARSINEPTTSMTKETNPSYTEDMMSTIGGGTAMRVDDGQGSGVIYAWYSDGGIKWWTDAEQVYMPLDCSNFLSGTDYGNVKAFSFSGFDSSGITTAENMFSGNTSISSVTFGDIFSEPDMTNVSGMFAGCQNLTSVDTVNINTGTLTAASNMFNGCSSLSQIEIGTEFSSGAVTDFSGMFAGCSNATSINIASLSTDSATTYENMFIGCSKLTSLDVEPLSTANVTNTNYMFKNCSALTSLELEAWNNASSKLAPTTMHGMFDGCSEATTINISCFNTGNTTDMGSLFANCGKLTEITGIDTLDTRNVTNMGFMFANTTALTELDLSSFDTAKVTTYNGMFYHESTDGKIAKIYASPRFAVKNTYTSQDMFKADTDLEGGRGTSFSTEHTRGDYARIDGWDGAPGYFIAKGKEATIRKSDFQTMFKGVTTDNVVKVTDSSLTYPSLESSGAKRVDDRTTSCRIYSWRDGNVVKWWTDADFAFMPKDSQKFFNPSGQNGLGDSNSVIRKIDFSGFDMTRVENMSYMFANADTPNPSVKEVVFGNMFYCDSLTTTKGMFNYCNGLTSIDMEHFVAGTGTLKNLDLMFQDCSSLKSITFGDFNTSAVKDWTGFFNGCTSVTAIHANTLSAAAATNMTNTFKNCESLTTLEFANAKPQSLSSAEAAFYNCHSLTSLNLPGWGFTNGANDLYQTFYNCSALTTADLSNWNVKNVRNMEETFYRCGMTTLNLTGWAPANVNTLKSTFADCPNLASLDMSGWSLTKVTTMENTFANDEKLTTLTIGDNWKLNSVTTMESAFANCKKLTGQNFAQMTSGANLTNLYHTFYECNALTELNLDGLRVGGVTSLKETFYNCKNMTSITVDSWRPTALEDLTSAFAGCTKLASVKLEGWGMAPTVGDITTDMFNDCTLLKTIELPKWSVTNKNNLNLIVKSAPKVETLNVPQWTVSKACATKEGFKFLNKSTLKYVDMSKWDLSFSTDNSLESAFAECQNLVNLNLSDWNVSEIKNLNLMMSNCKKLVTLDVSGWDVSKVEKTWKFLKGCALLERINFGTEWNLENVSNMATTFEECAKLDQDFHEIKTSDKLTNISFLFKNCSGLTKLDLRGWTVCSVQSMGEAFYGCKNLEELDITGWDPHLNSLYNDKQTVYAQYFNGSGMYGTFRDCEKLETLDLSGFVGTELYMDNSKDSGNYYTFYNCKALTTIYATDKLTMKASEANKNMFDNCFVLAGNKGTTYANNPDNKAKAVYARVDGGTSDPGYFTYVTETTLQLVQLNDWKTDANNKKSNILNDARAIKYFGRNTSLESEAYLPSEGVKRIELEGEVPVYLWQIQDSDNMYRVYWWSRASVVYVNPGSYNLFGSWGTKLPSGTYATIDLQGLDFSKVTNFEKMAYGIQATQILDGGSSEYVFDVSSATTLNNMFESSSIQSVAVKGNISNNFTSRKMFVSCKNLISADLSGLTVNGNITNTTNMFDGCTNLTTIYSKDAVNGFGKNKISTSSTGDMFKNCNNLTGPYTSFAVKKSTNHTYACIDKEGQEGYFTAK